MTQKTDAALIAQANVIKNETASGANTATRIGTMLNDLIESKPAKGLAEVTITKATTETFAATMATLALPTILGGYDAIITLAAGVHDVGAIADAPELRGFNGGRIIFTAPTVLEAAGTGQVSTINFNDYGQIQGLGLFCDVIYESLKITTEGEFQNILCNFKGNGKVIFHFCYFDFDLGELADSVICFSEGMTPIFDQCAFRESSTVLAQNSTAVVLGRGSNEGRGGIAEFHGCIAVGGRPFTYGVAGVGSAMFKDSDAAFVNKAATVEDIDSIIVLTSGDSARFIPLEPFEGSTTNIIPLDKLYTELPSTIVTGDMIVAPNTNTKINNGSCAVNFKGDGIHVLDISGFEKVGNLEFSNILDTNNVFYFAYVGGIYQYSILFQGIKTDDTLISPILVSANVVNTNKNRIRLKTSKLLNSTSIPLTSDFAININTITAVSIVGEYTLIDCLNDFDFGQTVTLSYTGINGRKIVDLNGNELANFTNTAITNNVLKTDSLQNSLAIADITAAFVAEKDYDFTFTGASIVSWINRLTGGYNLFSAGTAPTFNSALERIEGLAANTQLVTTPTTNKFLSGTPFTIFFVEDITASPTSKMLATDNVIGHQLGYISATQLFVRALPSIAQNIYNYTWVAGKKLHMIKRPASGSITWQVNGINITPASIGITTEVLNFNFIGMLNNNPANGIKGALIFNRELTTNEITTVKSELTAIFEL